MPLREWTARHPGRGARCLDRVSRRGAGPDEDPGIVRWEKSSRPRQGVALSSLPGGTDPWRGRGNLLVSYPGVVRADAPPTPGLRKTHLSEVLPLIVNSHIRPIRESLLESRLVEHPGRGASCIARVSRHEVPKTPG